MDAAVKLFTFADGDGINNIEESAANGFPVNSNTGTTTTDDREREGTRSSTRKLTETPKMKEYRLQLLERDFLTAQRACTRQIHKIQSLLENETTIPVLQQERGKLETRMEDLLNAHEDCFAALECDGKGLEQRERYERLDYVNQSTLRSLSRKISDLEFQREDDRRSVYSRHSNRSKRSDGSKATATSSSSALRKVEMVARAARLGAELKFHDIESQQTVTLKKQEDEIRKLQMMKELAATQAELEAVQKVDEEQYGVPNDTEETHLPKDSCADDQLERYLLSQMDSIHQTSASSCPLSVPKDSVSGVKTETKITFADGPDPPKPRVSAQEGKLCSTQSPYVPPLISSPPPVKPTPDVKLDSPVSDCSHAPSPTGEELIQKLADLLAQRQDRESLPRPEPMVFKGNPLEYPIWIKSFETFIERKTKDPSERLYYLGRYTAGEAKEAVSGLLTLDNGDAYQKAKKILTSRFGNQFMVADAFRKKINDWSKIAPNDGQALRKFSDFLEHCNTAMNTIRYLNVLDDPDENQKILKKLPNYLVARWSRIVDGWIAEEELDEDKTEEASQTARTSVKIGYPPFSEFCKFMTKEARISCNPVTSPQALRGDDKGSEEKTRARFQSRERRSPGAHAYATGLQEERFSNPRERESNPKGHACPYCKDNHELDVCAIFLKLPLTDRRKFVQVKGLCWGCLRWGHTQKECRRRKSCKTCSGRHPSCFHDDSQRYVDKNTSQASSDGNSNSISHRIGICNMKSHVDSVSHSLIVPVWLHHKDSPEKKIMVYALLDDQSDACFIKEETLQKLGVSGPETQLRLSTVLAEETITSQKVTGLVVRGVNESTEIPLPKTYARNIPARRSQIPRPETARKWPHLRRIADHLMPYKTDVDVGLLLGINCASAIKPREIIPGNDDDPYAKRTALGWGVIGIVKPQDLEDSGAADCVGANKIITREVQHSHKKTCHFALKTHTKEIFSPLQVNRMFELDFNETKTEEQALSYEDRQFVKKTTEGVHRRSDGHYELPLPFKQELLTLPNNKQVALKRLITLKRRLQNDSRYRKDYLAFMSDVIDRGYAEKVPATEAPLKNGQVWYIPHHGVYHPKKPEKIRVVFDCSVEFAGECLNRHLLQGPDPTNNLVGVLCRFRQEPVAFTCDIEGMFHQVKVDAKHRNFLRFLWWEDGNFDSEPLEYRMTVHLFGATSSPGCANFALKQTATDFEAQFGSEAANFVRNNFYVDDGLKSVTTAEAAITLIKNTKALCQKGGFNLHKFISNHKEVIDAIPLQDRAKSIQRLDITQNLPVERALGVQWCIESDTLQFRVEMKDHPLTRRGILSTVSSVFDPLGQLAPLILVGKSILQELCRDGADWDDKVPEPLRARWERWRGDLHLLSKLKIPRCYKPEGFGELKSVELHHFSDASKDAYGQCSYLRMVDHSDQIHCALTMAKSRVAPLKPVTIPRLELTAALVSVKISAILQKELEFDQITEVFWTDSKVVIGYISNDARRFHVFVANRVQQIRNHTSPSQWKYVETDKNPADDASRGLYAQNLIENERWWNGPDFLWESLDDESPSCSAECTNLSPDDPEVKRISTMASQTQEPFSLLERLKHISSWFRAKKAVALCLRLQKRYQTCPNKKTGTKGDEEDVKEPNVNTEDLQDAEMEIIKSIQKEEFQDEICFLGSLEAHDDLNDRAAVRAVKKSSNLHKYDPFLDENGILRVGGRLKHADLSSDVKHPVILPKKGHVTDLIISHHHDSVEHQGRGITRNSIRSAGFQIVGEGSAVSNHIAQCVPCRRMRRPVEQQKMADLPEDRVQPSPPFSYCAVDYFGPWYIREGRRELKRYGVLFTCLASRAVHIEVSHSMTTDSFINAYRRFVGRRGPVRQMRSDQGTNFVGAKNELQRALSELDNGKIREELLKRNCDWVVFKMNVPHASHMGGVWERQIRTVRSVLTALLNSNGSQLNDESLHTFMVEAESIVNCRPLTAADVSSPDGVRALTPNHLLTMKSSVVLPPPGSFQRADLYLTKRWRRVQYLVNEFWNKWKGDFLQSLQSRQKWGQVRRNMMVGDIVIVKDENLPRNQWQLARVVQTYPGDDGLVRKVMVTVADPALGKDGRRVKPPVSLERPIQKLVLLVPRD